jgi:oxygen-independent coproporphyrinogen-3 oxidase
MAGIYLHIPFCRQACHYCDFHFSTSLKNEDALIDAMIAELILRKAEIEESIGTIYFGGGTPSILSEENLGKLMEAVHTNFEVDSDAEVTLEANPEDLDKAKLEALKALNVNRLSVGVQSFREADLVWMNRAHTKEEALTSLQNAQEMGFKDLNLDLIYGIPNMPFEVWKSNVDLALSLGANHLSAYNLTVESGTALAKFVQQKKVEAPNDDQSIIELEYLNSRIDALNWTRYEISNFCEGENFAKHNTNYWRGKAYLGVGPSAHSYNPKRKERRWNVRNNSKYIKQVTQGESYFEIEHLNEKDLLNESIMIGLRTKWGLDLTAFNSALLHSFGASAHDQLKSFTVAFNKGVKAGFLIKKDDCLYLTEAGKNVADYVISELFIL